MQLLVSVTSAREARSALLGGADLIDAKNPRRGALGAVTPRVLRSIHTTVHPHRLVSAALGDAVDEAAIARRADSAAAAGVAYIKVGFRGIAVPTRAFALAAAAARGAWEKRGGIKVVLVAYADAGRAESLPPETLVEIASRVGAAGVLLDTALKGGGGLFDLVAPETVGDWVDAAHAAGLTAGLAGSLSASDFPT
ncbi:MAG: (5-formylfuran-3-yl)methyl phosphate synthase, partial [Gemmatimonadales bacterium]